MNPFFKATRPASKKEVLSTAVRLMKHYGETTTLEVKLELREQGYIAYQSEIASLMMKLCQEEGWETDYNGLYRTFSLGPMPEWLVALLIICPN